MSPLTIRRCVRSVCRRLRRLLSPVHHILPDKCQAKCLLYTGGGGGSGTLSSRPFPPSSIVKLIISSIPITISDQNPGYPTGYSTSINTCDYFIQKCDDSVCQVRLSQLLCSTVKCIRRFTKLLYSIQQIGEAQRLQPSSGEAGF